MVSRLAGAGASLVSRSGDRPATWRRSASGSELRPAFASRPLRGPWATAICTATPPTRRAHPRCRGAALERLAGEGWGSLLLGPGPVVGPRYDDGRAARRVGGRRARRWSPPGRPARGVGLGPRLYGPASGRPVLACPGPRTSRGAEQPGEEAERFQRADDRASPAGRCRSGRRPGVAALAVSWLGIVYFAEPWGTSLLPSGMDAMCYWAPSSPTRTSIRTGRPDRLPVLAGVPAAPRADPALAVAGLHGRLGRDPHGRDGVHDRAAVDPARSGLLRSDGDLGRQHRAAGRGGDRGRAFAGRRRGRSCC
jgi:hypothetical protein